MARYEFMIEGRSVTVTADTQTKADAIERNLKATGEKARAAMRRLGLSEAIATDTAQCAVLEAAREQRTPAQADTSVKALAASAKKEQAALVQLEERANAALDRLGVARKGGE
jgi:hypothetical protein